MGRVFRQPRFGGSLRTTASRRDVLDVLRRVLRRGIRGAVLEARFAEARCAKTAQQASAESELCDPALQRRPQCAGATARVQTDCDGYFHVRLRCGSPLATDQQWHRIDLQLVEPAELAADEGATAQGQVFVPPPRARRVIISDIDDTVMYTGVLNKAAMMWRLFMQGPKSRLAFPGVAALYRALHAGPAGDELNPMLYVSRAPWGIYEVLQEFFRLHRIPVGPILFLREWGITLRRPLPRRAEDHKLILIRDMLKLYHDLPFVLIGDSGQHDPEIYARIVQEHPGRVAAVYVRNVTRSPERVEAIEELAKQVLDSGSTLMLAGDSYSMAEHAADHGLIAPEELPEVLREQEADAARSPSRWTREIKRATAQQTRQAVEQGALRGTLEEETGVDAPPNVTVEAKHR